MDMTRAPLSALVGMIVGCSSGGGGSSSQLAPASWPAGQYELEAALQYRQDSETATETVSEVHNAALEITAGGPMALSDESGVCREMASTEGQQGADRRRLFQCRGVTYTIEMSGQDLGGEVAASVLERVRLNEGCARYRAGTTVCREYRWTVNTARTTKRAPLTVTPRS